MAGQNGPCKEEQTELLAGEKNASSNTEAVTLPVIGVLEAASPRPSKLAVPGRAPIGTGRGASRLANDLLHGQV